jgi:hypothetical protein
MAGRDKSSNIDERSRRRLVPGDKIWFITGFKEIMTIAIPRRPAPVTNNIPLQRKAKLAICTHPLSYNWMCFFISIRVYGKQK